MMSLSKSNCTSEIPLVLNPDIGGVGVRISFYLQTFLLGQLRPMRSLVWSTDLGFFSLTSRPLMARSAECIMDLHRNQLWANLGSLGAGRPG